MGPGLLEELFPILPFSEGRWDVIFLGESLLLDWNRHGNPTVSCDWVIEGTKVD